MSPRKSHPVARRRATKGHPPPHTIHKPSVTIAGIKAPEMSTRPSLSKTQQLTLCSLSDDSLAHIYTHTYPPLGKCGEGPVDEGSTGLMRAEMLGSSPCL